MVKVILGITNLGHKGTDLGNPITGSSEPKYLNIESPLDPWPKLNLSPSLSLGLLLTYPITQVLKKFCQPKPRRTWLSEELRPRF